MPTSLSNHFRIALKRPWHSIICYVSNIDESKIRYLIFSYLLDLAKEGFIELSTKPDSVEINEITLGVESNWLIEENLTTCEQFINN